MFAHNATVEASLVDDDDRINDARQMSSPASAAAAAAAGAAQNPQHQYQRQVQQRFRFAAQRSKSSDKCGQINAALIAEFAQQSHQHNSNNSRSANRPPLGPHARKPHPPLRHSLTFNGADDLLLLNATSGSGATSSTASSSSSDINNTHARLLFGGGSTGATSSSSDSSASEKMFLENQLHSYSEQLRNITESVRRYAEQAKLLSDIRSHRADKQQQQQQLAAAARKKPPPNTLPIEAMKTPTTATTTTPLLSAGHDVITPSHQLRVFLENIRYSMRDPGVSTIDEFPDDGGDSVGLLPAAAAPPSSAAIAEPGQTPSDQLHSFLDAIRSNYMHDNTNGTATTKTMTTTTKHSNGINGGTVYRGTLDEMSEHFVNNNDQENHQQAHQQRLHIGRKPGGESAFGDVSMHKLKSILHACRKKSGAAHVQTDDAVQFLRDCVARGPQLQQQPQQHRLMRDLKHTDDLHMEQLLLRQPQYDGVIIVVNRIQLFCDVIEMQNQLSEVYN